LGEMATLPCPSAGYGGLGMARLSFS
jgi:hypothetical protein